MSGYLVLRMGILIYLKVAHISITCLILSDYTYCPFADEGFQCGLCMTTSPTVLDHPLVEELLQREQVQQRSRFCGQCGERGKQANAAGTCEQCSTELCGDCISVS